MDVWELAFKICAEKCPQALLNVRAHPDGTSRVFSHDYTEYKGIAKYTIPNAEPCTPELLKLIEETEKKNNG